MSNSYLTISMILTYMILKYFESDNLYLYECSYLCSYYMHI